MSGPDIAATVIIPGFVLAMLLRIFYMPGFFRHMPKAAPGQWEAVAMTVTAFGGRRERACRKCRGLRRAYLTARWLALKLDWATPNCDGEIGVDWGVRRADTELDPEDV